MSDTESAAYNQSLSLFLNQQRVLDNEAYAINVV